MKTKRELIFSIFFGALVSAVAPSAGMAGDDGLYEGVFDPTSSFVRVLAPSQTFAVIDGTTLRDFNAGLSPYVNVMPGQIEVTMSDASAQLSIDPSKHYTVLYLDGADVITLEDEVVQSPAKSDVLFYNLSDSDDVEVFVPLAKATVIKSVSHASVGAVALKAPLTLDLQLRDTSGPLVTAEAVELKRKEGVSIVLTGHNGAFEAAAIPNAYSK